MSSTYLVCRVHGYAPKLLTRDAILDIASSHTLAEFVERLSKTDYGRRLEGADELPEVEKGLAETFMDKLRAVVDASSGRIKSLLRSYLRRFEVQSLVAVVRMKAGGAPGVEVEELLTPVEEFAAVDLKALAEAEGLEQALEIIRKPGIYHIPEDVEGVLSVEAALWTSYYRQLLRDISTPGLEDKREIKGMVGLELDLHNLKTCLLIIDGAIDPKYAEKLIAKNPVGIPYEQLTKLAKTRDRERLIKQTPQYRAFLEKLTSTEPWMAEIERYRIMKGYVDGLRIPKFASLFYVVRYLLSLEIEYRNLRAIAVSIYHDLPPETRFRIII